MPIQSDKEKNLELKIFRCIPLSFKSKYRKMPSACGELGITIKEINSLITASNGMERWLSDQLINILSWLLPSGLRLISSGKFLNHITPQRKLHYSLLTTGNLLTARTIVLKVLKYTHSLRLCPYTLGALPRDGFLVS